MTTARKRKLVKGTRHSLKKKSNMLIIQVFNTNRTPASSVMKRSNKQHARPIYICHVSIRIRINLQRFINAIIW